MLCCVQVACGCESGTVVVWDVEAREELQRLHGHSDTVSGCEFSPDGRWLASAGADGQLLLWDVECGSQAHSFQGHKGPIAMCQWRPDSQRACPFTEPYPQTYVYNDNKLVICSCVYVHVHVRQGMWQSMCTTTHR